ncbi:hypothetical protein NC653_026677 [Populus alba x Populus x berolinensis]|uniref:Uncharacterized protein n=1 Tax=Populus alba x Populus x berolinensis TaxID=444605 RepID=A0AAD6MEM2_9ROSI|nr:hypothetical protein NC653_026677 [Populus alba x Populus x berolinensis]
MWNREACCLDNSRWSFLPPAMAGGKCITGEREDSRQNELSRVKGLPLLGVGILASGIVVEANLAGISQHCTIKQGQPKSFHSKYELPSILPTSL